MTVSRAANLAFGKPSTCGEPVDFIEYTSAEHPSTCNVQTDGEIDWSVAQTVNGGCPGDGVCITGLGRKLSIDDERTAALPEHGGTAFSCPYHGEG